MISTDQSGSQKLIFAPDITRSCLLQNHDRLPPSPHTGLHRYRRLNFGISSAAEVFQDIIRGVLVGLKGTFNVSDDILVHAPTLETHLTRLQAVLQRLQEHGLTLHKEKCEFL
mgnify:CR=1 FL=1